MRIKIIVSFVSVVLVAALAFGVFANGETTKTEIIPEGYIDLEEYGGYAGDGKDDTQAFKDALDTGRNIYLRKGQYDVCETIEIQNQNLIGCSSIQTMIVSTNKSAADPIIRMGGLCRLEGLQLTYETSCINKNEKQGERVGISLGCQTPVEPGSVIKEVGISWVGTGIYSPNSENSGGNGLRIDTSTIGKYIYRGVDFQKVGQYGNLISNLYICNLHSEEIYADAAFAVEGEEYNLQADQLNIEGMPVRHDLLLKNCRNAQFGSVHMEAVKFKEANAGLVKVDDSSVRIDGLTAYYIHANQPNCALIELGEAQNSESNGNYLRIGTLHFKGFGSEGAGFNSQNGKSFKIVKRTSGANGTYTFNLDKYVWYTWLGEASVYESFPCDENGITYLSKGN